MRLWITFLSCASLAWLGVAPAHAQSESANKALVTRYVESCLATGEAGCLAEYWGAEKAARVAKGEALRRACFPDLSYRLDELLADGDRVAAALTVRGHHPSPPGGEAAAPEALELHEVVVYTVHAGRLESGRVFSDRMTVALAPGWNVSPPKGAAPVDKPE